MIETELAIALALAAFAAGVAVGFLSAVWRLREARKKARTARALLSGSQVERDDATRRRIERREAHKRQRAQRRRKKR